MGENQSSLRWVLIAALGIALVWFVRARLRRRKRKAALDRARDTAGRFLAAAQEEASRLNERSVGVEHLLLGLLRDPNERATGLLADAGVRVNELSAAVGRALDAGVNAQGVDVTPRAKRVLKRAAKEARRLKQEDVGPEHLLLALLRDRKGIAARTLEAEGVDAKSLRQTLTEKLQSQT
jgi:ATP-dependent Clp protease ATP-binding subunit ClpC